MTKFLNNAWYKSALSSNFWMRWRFQIIKNLILKHRIKPNRILDVGCGEAVFAEQYFKYFKKKISGCDININIKKEIKKKILIFLNLKFQKKIKSIKNHLILFFYLMLLNM